MDSECLIGQDSILVNSKAHTEKECVSRGIFVSVKGLEPLTNGLKGRCSTIELHARRGTFYHAAPITSIDLADQSTGIRRGMAHLRICLDKHFQD